MKVKLNRISGSPVEMSAIEATISVAGAGKYSEVSLMLGKDRVIGSLALKRSLVPVFSKTLRLPDLAKISVIKITFDKDRFALAVHYRDGVVVKTSKFHSLGGIPFSVISEGAEGKPMLESSHALFKFWEYSLDAAESQILLDALARCLILWTQEGTLNE